MFDSKKVKDVQEVKDVKFLAIGDGGDAAPDVEVNGVLHLEILDMVDVPNEDGEAVEQLLVKVLETGEERKTNQSVLISRAKIVLKEGRKNMKIIYLGLENTTKGNRSYHNFACTSFVYG